MKNIFLLTTFLIFLVTKICISQDYDIVIKEGHVIDAKNGINQVMDVAVKDGKIAMVSGNIPKEQGRQVVDASGMYVTPGLIDIHTHVFAGTEPNRAYSNGFRALPPDGFTFRVGVTTVVDCGGAGWKTFPTFKRNIIDRSKTRVLAFLNIVGEGMRGGVYEQNTHDMDPKMSALVASQYPGDIVGFKVAHYSGREWTPVDRAVEAGNRTELPVVIDFGGASPPLSIKELFFDHLRPGDIFTHAFAQLGSREYIVDLDQQKVKPFVFEAQNKGIIFDVGYGGISFSYSQAIPAIDEGFFPNTISTDLHAGSMNGAMKDMLNVMSKFLVMGMDLKEVIKASTWSPAKVIKKQELGNLSMNAPADIALFTLLKGDFGYYDYTGTRQSGDVKLECEMTIRDGKIVYDLNGIASPIVVRR